MIGHTQTVGGLLALASARVRGRAELPSDGTGPVFRGDAQELRERIGEVTATISTAGAAR